MSSRFKYFLKSLLAFFLLANTFLHAQVQRFIYYGIKDGLAHSQVTHLFCDSAGNLYFSTLGGGISVFNGKAFKSYNKKNGLKRMSVRACSYGPGNKIYAGTFTGGLYRLDKDSAILINDSVFKSDVFALCYAAGKLWIGTGNGLFTWDGKKFENLTPKWKLPVYAITFLSADKDGNIWFGYDEQYGLYRSKNGKLQCFSSSNGLTDARLLNCFHDSKGNTWVSASDGIYKIAKDASLAAKDNTPGLPAYYAFDIVEQDGDLIIGSNNGLHIYNPAEQRVKQIISDNNGLAAKGVFRLIKDLEGNVWLSNWGQGIARLVQSGLVKYDESSGFEKKAVSGFYEEGNNLFAVGRNAIYKEENTSFKSVFPSPATDIVRVFFNSVNDMWVMFPTRISHVVNGKAKEFYGDSVAGARQAVMDNTGQLWFAGWGCGIFKMVNDAYVPVKDTLPSQHKYYYTVFKDSKGRLWFGSSGAGILRYDGKAWKRFTEADGLQSERITSFAESPEGLIYAASPDAGLACIFPGDKISLVEEGIAKPLNSINALAFLDGYLWLGGISQLQRLKIEDAKIVEEDAWKEEEGFNADCMIDGLYADKKGRMLVGTNQYCFAFDKKLRHMPSNHLLVQIDEIKVKEIPLGRTLDMPELPYNKNRISFSCYCNRMANKGDVQCYYRMLGLDTNFTASSIDNDIVFHELQPGQYKFQVKAFMKGVWSPVTEFNFVIHPPFWRTWWFYTMVILAVILLFALYVKFREQKLKNDKIRLEQIVSVRTKEISEQKALIEEKQKEILDSIHYAKRIQNAIIPNEKAMRKMLGRKK